MNNCPKNNSPKGALLQIHKKHTKFIFKIITITMVIKFNLLLTCNND